jgi:hypothetical protein
MGNGRDGLAVRPLATEPPHSVKTWRAWVKRGLSNRLNLLAFPEILQGF